MKLTGKRPNSSNPRAEKALSEARERASEIISSAEIKADEIRAVAWADQGEANDRELERLMAKLRQLTIVTVEEAGGPTDLIALLTETIDGFMQAAGRDPVAETTTDPTEPPDREPPTIALDGAFDGDLLEGTDLIEGTWVAQIELEEHEFFDFTHRDESEFFSRRRAA